MIYNQTLSGVKTKSFLDFTTSKPLSETSPLTSCSSSEKGWVKNLFKWYKSSKGYKRTKIGKKLKTQIRVDWG